MGTPSFADLVDRQVRTWLEQAHVSPSGGEAIVRQKPMITSYNFV